MFLFCIAICTSCSNQNQSMPGYIEGEYTYIASGVAGTLFKLYVERGQQIKKGDILYQLDPQPEQADVDIAKANIGDLQAQVNFAKVQLDRQRKLYPRNATPKSEVDQAQKDYESKAHELAANQFQLTHSQWPYNKKQSMHLLEAKYLISFIVSEKKYKKIILFWLY